MGRYSQYQSELVLPNKNLSGHGRGRLGRFSPARLVVGYRVIAIEEDREEEEELGGI